ncbi:MAG: hypothetical protein ABI639_08425 [Thermoanaerobaculia bacterium]
MMTARSFCLVVGTVVGALGGAVGAVSAASLPAERVAPPYATEESLRTPKLFAEGVISTEDDEFGGSFSPDGKTVYFSRSAPHSYHYAILESHFVRGKWTTPVVPSFSGQFTDSDPIYSPDGTRMFWSSDRPVDGKTKHDYDIWMVEKTASGRWSAPKHLPAPIASEGSEYCASMARDGTLYFSSSRDGGEFGLIQAYRSRYENGAWSPPENLSREMNGPEMAGAFYDLDVFVDPDQRFVLLGSQRPEGLGNFDVYISWNRDGKWSKPFHPDAPLNSAARDYAPHISPDGRYLFYSSERGLGLETLPAPLSYSELRARLHGTLNSSGNIYQVELSVLDAMAGEKAPLADR